MKISYKIVKDFAGLSIEKYLEAFEISKTKTKLLWQGKKFLLNQKECSPNFVLKEDDVLEIEYTEHRDFLPDKKKLDISYEDEYLLIVNKPTNILVHPDDKNKQGTLCNIVSYYFQNKNLDCQIKYAHRLDLETTGLIIFVYDQLTHAKINAMIERHELKRTYLCFVQGKLKEKQGEIIAKIGLDRHHQQRRRVSKTGKEAITHYEVIKEYKGYSLLKVQLKTGRTHQIRVHMAHIGHPLLGDELYGGNVELANRVMLHSYQVEFIHPVTKQNMKITKNVPFDMQKLL